MRNFAGGFGVIVAIGCSLLTGLVLVLTFINSQKAAARHEVVLGYIPASLEYPYNVATERGFQAEARRLGAKVLIVDPRGSVEKQANAVDDLLAQGAHGIAVLPLDAVIAQTWVDKVTDSGIPFVSLVTQIGDPSKVGWADVYPKLSALVGMDNRIAGAKAAEIAARILPAHRTAKIAIIEGAPGYPQVWERSEGFRQGLRKAGIGFKIVASQPTDWTAENGEAVCQNVLSAHPDVDLIFSQADDMAIGCARALDAARSDVALVATGGGSRLGVQAIKAGDIDGSVCDKPFETGVLAARALFEAVSRRDAPKARLIGVETPAVTARNLADCPAPW